MSHNITVQGGTSVRLPTAGKYCDRDILVTATGGGVDLPELTNEGGASDLMLDKELIGSAGEVVKGTFTLAAEMNEQDSLIEQIKASLQGKAAGGGGVCAPTTISGVNLHDTATDIPNTYLQGATVNAYNGWTTTDFIPVEDGKFYIAYSTSLVEARYCSKFNANKEGASSLSGTINCTNKNRPIILNGHDGYFRFSGTATQIAALEFYEVINFNWEV